MSLRAERVTSSGGTARSSRLQEGSVDEPLRLVPRAGSARRDRRRRRSFDWPQWQGPDRNAVSKEKGLLQEWPKDGPPLAWKAKGLGGGDSAPSVAGGRLFGMSNRGDDEVVWCLSEADGKEVWATPPRAGRSSSGCRSRRKGRAARRRSTATGSTSWAWAATWPASRSRTARILWRVSLTKDLGGSVPMWSYRESPLVDGDKLICTPGGRGRDPRGPRQGDRQDDLEEQGARGATGDRGFSASPGRPTPRSSRSTSTGSGSTCSSPRRRSSGSRRPTASSCGGTTGPPTGMGSTAPRRSTTTAWCSPPRPTARAAGW